MSLFEEIRLLNPRSPESWPASIKAGALATLLVAIIAVGVILDWHEQWEILDRAKTEETELKEAYLAKRRNAANLDILRQQLQDIEQSLGTVLKQLPSKSEMDALLIDVNQAGLGRGLQFELFRPATSETITEFYAELPITIRVTGSYHDIGAFASDITQLPRIVTLNNINIAPNTKGDLVLDATVKTFRHLDEEEAKQKKAAALAIEGKK
ncbi:MAG: type 4a pilus biogenesis protein PilO [Nitrosomonadaceae bacterium]|nr:type 4a pilus biogenesis protein PilO [Nitrosomonadaceae bacterium]